jgi:hypothetical protein
MRRRAIPEISSNETAENQRISPKAVFGCLLCGPGHLIKPNFFPDSCQRRAQ